MVEMSDVWLCASPRKEEEWEEDLASQRAQAAKQVLYMLPPTACCPLSSAATCDGGPDPHMALWLGNYML